MIIACDNYIYICLIYYFCIDIFTVLFLFLQSIVGRMQVAAANLPRPR